MSDTASELHSMVRNIVEELEAAVAGTLYWDGNGYLVIDDMDDWKEERYKEKADKFIETHDGTWDADLYGSFDEYMENEIGTADDVDEPDEVSLSEYIEKQGLGDTRFEVDSSKQLLGGKTLFTYGGPNIWVHDDEVRGYWGSEQVEMRLDSDTRSALFSWFEEKWDVVSG
jgi:hypothetical protein